MKVVNTYSYCQIIKKFFSDSFSQCMNHAKSCEIALFSTDPPEGTAPYCRYIRYRTYTDAHRLQLHNMIPEVRISYVFRWVQFFTNNSARIWNAISMKIVTKSILTPKESYPLIGGCSTDRHLTVLE